MLKEIEARVKITSEEAKRIKNYFTGWIVKTNNIKYYRNNVRNVDGEFYRKSVLKKFNINFNERKINIKISNESNAMEEKSEPLRSIKRERHSVILKKLNLEIFLDYIEDEIFLEVEELFYRNRNLLDKVVIFLITGNLNYFLVMYFSILDFKLGFKKKTLTKWSNKPITLNRLNAPKNIETNYFKSIKADGIFVYIINGIEVPLVAKEAMIWDKNINELLNSDVFVGEKMNNGDIYIFDIVVKNGSLFKTDDLKNIKLPDGMKLKDNAFTLESDGIIYTEMDKHYHNAKIYKYKPSSHQTIDLLVNEVGEVLTKENDIISIIDINDFKGELNEINEFLVTNEYGDLEFIRTRKDKDYPNSTYIYTNILETIKNPYIINEGKKNN